MTQFSDFTISQMDKAWKINQSEAVMRTVLNRPWTILGAHVTGSINPNNTSRLSGSMPPWHR